MEFLYPSFLWALLALAIPIIIHLFHFRRFKKVLFTNVKFLQEIKEETSSRSRIKNLLVLLSRMLAVAALVFAFAQPYIPQGKDVKKGNSAVSVFVDNSFSMRAESQGIPLIDIAKEKARQVISAYGEEDRFQILTNDFIARQQRLLSKDDALAIIDNIDVSPAVAAMSKVISRQKQATFGQEENEISFLISDFQQDITDISNYADTTLEVNLVPIQSVQEANVAVDSVWLESAVPMINQNNKLIVKLTNYSEVAAEGMRLSMVKDGQEKPEGIFDIPANRSIIDTINVTLLKAGWHKIDIKVSDYPIQFDNTYHVALNVPENIKVMSINRGQNNRYLTALFNGLNLYQLNNQREGNVDYAAMAEYDLIICNDLSSLSSGLAAELTNYIRAGGNVLMFPGAGADAGSYNQFLNGLQANTLTSYETESRSVSQINTEEFIFSEVYEYVGRNIKLPASSGGFGLTNYQNRDEEYLLQYRDGGDYMVKYQRGKGHLYLCTSPLDSDVNDLVLNAEVFVPMLYKMAIASEQQQKISYTIARDEIIEVEGQSASAETVYHITGEEDFIPAKTNLGSRVLLDVNGQIRTAGYHALSLDDNKVADLAFNYDRMESNTKLTARSMLQELATGPQFTLFDNAISAELGTQISEKDKGIVLWKWCLIFALIFLAVETLLLRLLPK